MKIVVVTALNAGSLQAHALNTVNTAHAFAKLGHDVTIVCYQHNTQKLTTPDLNLIYNIKVDMQWVRIPYKKIWRFDTGPHWVFAIMTFPIILGLKPDLIFARNYVVPWLTANWGIPTMAESHAHVGHNTMSFRRFINGTKSKHFLKLVTISPILAEYYRKLGAPKEKLLILPTGVNLQRFFRPKILPISPYNTSKNIVYAGHLYDYKGIPTILEAAKILPTFQFHLVGGTQADIERHQVKAKTMGIQNVIFHGLKSQHELPSFLWHADLLLLPPSQHHPSARWTSPVKLGEYLASGTPIIATAIDALRYWLKDEVIFVEPDNALELSRAIEQTYQMPTESKHALIERGYSKAREFQYETRLKHLLRSTGL